MAYDSELILKDYQMIHQKVIALHNQETLMTKMSLKDHEPIQEYIMGEQA